MNTDEHGTRNLCYSVQSVANLRLKRRPSCSRHSCGVRNRSPWRSMLGHALHQLHENDLFTSAAAMSYFGLMALFPALLLMFSLSNKLAAGSQLLTHAVDVYPGSSKL